jgi:MYXO-CTERM domain-containing protein
VVAVSFDILDNDDDGDGVLTSQELGDGEVPADTDGDGVPDYLDEDSDGDGISDAIESEGRDSDADNDGIDDRIDTDSDGDGDSDADEGSGDDDNDGIPNFRDSDDADGPDGDEDGDGVTNADEEARGTSPTEADSDGDGISDEEEGTADSDGDGIIDALDSDDDNDGIPTAFELELGGSDDIDGDGIPNYLDVDADGNGIDDADEATLDSDNDGIVDWLDTDDNDSDSDGVVDAVDVCQALADDQTDTDGDGVGDACDSDADGDGVEDDATAFGGGLSCSTSNTTATAPFSMAMVLFGLFAARRRRRQAPLLAVASAAVAVSSAPAMAEGPFPADHFRPTMDANGILDVESPTVPRHLDFDIGVVESWAKDPLVLRNAAGERLESVVGSRFTTSITGQLTLWDAVEVGFDIPVVGQASPLSGSAAPGGFGVGDVRLAPKVALLRQADTGVNVALMSSVTLPSSDPSLLAGESGVSYVPQVLVGHVFDGLGLRLNGSLGATVRDRASLRGLTIDDDVFAQLGAGYTLSALPMKAELQASLRVTAPLHGDVTSGTPLEGLVGAAVPVWGPLALSVAVGGAPVAGAGAADVRAFVGLRWSERQPAPVPVVVAPTIEYRERIVERVVERVVEKPVEVQVQVPAVCPEAPVAEAHIEGARIEIAGKVSFRRATAELDASGERVVDEVAALLVAHPEVKRVRIEGHTDGDGTPATNADLSQRRADAVLQRLVSKGVAVERLEARGFGEDRPVASNDTPEGRDQNRRVEFLVAE